MKAWQKAALSFAVPTLSMLHSRWIAWVMSAAWDESAQHFALGVMIISTLIAVPLIWLNGTEW